MAVEIICKERGIDLRSPIRRLMLENLYVYKHQAGKEGETVIAQDQTKHSELEEAFRRQLESFNEKRDIIKG